MVKYLIAVDSGHGMSTPGKRTPKLTKNLYIDGKLVKKKGDIIHEKEFNKASAEYLIKALERCGFDTVNVSPGTSDVSLQDRVRKANNAGADFYISKHYNAIGSCSKFQDNVKGIVSIYNYGSSRSEKAAKLIQSELIKEHGGFNFNARSDKDISGFSLYVISNTKMTAVLTESGFMDYQPEAERMLDPKFQKEDAEATCRGICKYFGVAYKKESTPTASNKKKLIKNIYGKEINIRSSADWNGKIVGKLKAGDSLTLKEGPLTAKNGFTKMYKTILGTYVTASSKYVKIIEI
ncbi:N-acetylmuramoyl-L-alanine amidase [Terrisporobacter petrolearius]|uniref:N-acetylmuramoyl-L-alanine amidase n=1 Tax=Terrisporobacter petrolearius TaxID=1460447 RepID=UPI003B007289